MPGLSGRSPRPYRRRPFAVEDADGHRPHLRCRLTLVRVLGLQPLAGAEDMAIPQCVATADEAIALLREHHAGWAGGEARA